MQQKDGINGMFLVIVTVSFISGVINFWNMFRRPTKSHVEALENIIAEQQKTISSLEKKIDQYQAIVDYDNRDKHNLE